MLLTNQNYVMPKSSFKDIPEDIKDEYYGLHISKVKIEKDLQSLNIESQEIIKNALKEIDAKKDLLLKKLNKIERAMNILHPQQDEYDVKTGWKEKTIWVLKNTDRLLPVSTIVSKIRVLENDFDTALNPIIRLTIKRMEVKNEIIKYEDPNLSNIHYGLPEWFIDGKLMEAYYF